jgi:3-phenylpropionate/trans-cinnamate dioxygenase ferredoxin component
MTSEPAARRIRACSVADVAIGAAFKFEMDAGAICIVHCDDGFHAVADRCSHEDYSLSEGDVDAAQCEIECWKHGSLFSLTTGEPLTLPATLPIEVYPVEIEGNDVFVVLP